MSLLSLSNKTATLMRLTETKTSSGARYTSSASVSSGHACVLQPVTGRKRDEFSSGGMEVDHVAYFPNDIGATTNDYLVIDSKNYAVQHIEDQGGRGAVYAVYCLFKEK